ncbi:acyl-CoA thioesterase/bile acid-CoA:amino acid N-acyltransferase family protein [Heyndrickxia sp. FSL K6-6286]|uniref:acyl-CoA thioesterase/bile acid-CoA:amino acid N-acyltransferase family protein n=1 Tax=Heyndrickxia sp. FSL K6-6286 TaxID=2921510 RepID=UPI00315AB4C4
MSLMNKNKPRIVVSESISLIDSPVKITIQDVKPGKKVTIKAKRIATGLKRLELESYAIFIVDRSGKVELDSEEPISGSYSGVDGMGLFWSLELTKIEELSLNSEYNVAPLAPQIFTLYLEINQTIVHEIKITRLWKSDNIARHEIRENGLVATLFCMNDRTPLPAIIVLGGSEGGINEYLPALLSSHGFTVFALAYFGMEDLPKQVVRIPLEYMKSAIDWIKSRPEAIPNWIGIHGTSKGSELALLTASYFQEIKAVVSLNGSAISFSGIVPWSEDEKLPPAWTYKGIPIPYASPKNPINVALECIEMRQKGVGDPLEKWYNALCSDPEVVEKAVIPVEKINGNILLVSGKERLNFFMKV